MKKYKAKAIITLILLWVMLLWEWHFIYSVLSPALEVLKDVRGTQYSVLTKTAVYIFPLLPIILIVLGVSPLLIPIIRKIVIRDTNWEDIFRVTDTQAKIMLFISFLITMFFCHSLMKPLFESICNL
ncbi:MAG: hypothetical protein A2W23_05865 [Planctomycetes bacterium RBG_16_43_13]|nr:MAG: hypothetical protein A2W23_05865 [Planctomycetes bacterium RBG_16_43_13]